MEQETIYIWPNGDWCYSDELEWFQHNRSDDFRTDMVPWHWGYPEVQEYVDDLLD
jgi:hypothetical protein